MEGLQSSYLPEMSTSKNTKYNTGAAIFTPSKKEQQRYSPVNVSLTASSSEGKMNENVNKMSKKPVLKQPKLREKAHSTLKSSKIQDGRMLKDPFEEQILNGKVKPNSRRGQISINHLLDFSLPEEYNHSHKTQQQQRPNRRRKSHGNNGFGPKIHLTGDRYINVNYKFVVDHRGDYRPQILDTNLPIDRNSILRVIIPKNDTQCPICLSDDLVAPRMTSCGHSFCLTCLLRYLDSEDPIPPKKNETVKLAPKLKECPLCAKKIKPDETLPVLINPIDERFETPKVGEDTVLQLMYRPHNKILAFPYQLKLKNPEIYNGNIPWFTTSDSREYDHNAITIYGSDLFQYSRLMKADVSFSTKNYMREIDEIKTQYEEDKVLFNDDGIYYRKAVKEIELQMNASKVATADDKFSQMSLNDSSLQPQFEVPLEELTQRQYQQSEFNDSNTFFFYQTSFNSKIKFFVSSLDTKILKELYGNYSNFPLCLKIKVENILYDYVVNDELIKRFKFLSYLPHGTEIAFLELNWFEEPIPPFSRNKKYNTSQKRKSILPPEIYQKFQKELISRSDKIRIKNFKEEKSRLRYQDELELKTKEFYANENNFKLEDYGVHSYNKFDSLSISDDGYEEENLPPLTFQTDHDEEDATNYQTTVWGTKIAKADVVIEEEDDDDDFFNELLRQSKEKEEKKKSKKSKKKLVLMGSK